MRLDYRPGAKLVSYDPDTGIFTNKKTGEIRRIYYHNGYSSLCINNTTHSCGILAYCIMTGNNVPPHCHIRFKNKDGSDLRWDNIEVLVISRYRVGETHVRSKYDLPPGVSYTYNESRPYKARISITPKTYYLGSFETAEEASEVYLQAVELGKNGDLEGIKNLKSHHSLQARKSREK